MIFLDSFLISLIIRYIINAMLGVEDDKELEASIPHDFHGELIAL